ncbi:MAG: hypothetical protein ACI4JS_00455 [Oscillospiraceae bacterium]
MAEAYNSEKAIGFDGQPSARLAMGQDGIKVEGVLSILNSSGSGYNQWKIDKNVNGGYPYPFEIT